MTTSPEPFGLFLLNFTGMLPRWTFINIVKIVPFQWTPWPPELNIEQSLYANSSTLCLFHSNFTGTERKAMIRNRYNYPTPPIRDIKGKETQTRNNRTLMETSLAESQTDSYFPIKWPNDYPKQKDVSDTYIQRRTITKTNHDRRTSLERSVKSISLGA